jgi:hypothetical protein
MPDYLIEDTCWKFVIEIGGQSKGRQQLKGVSIDCKIAVAHRPLPEKGRRPLILLGYLGEWRNSDRQTGPDQTITL